MIWLNSSQRTQGNIAVFTNQIEKSLPHFIQQDKCDVGCDVCIPVCLSLTVYSYLLDESCDTVTSLNRSESHSNILWRVFLKDENKYGDKTLLQFVFYYTHYSILTFSLPPFHIFYPSIFLPSHPFSFFLSAYRSSYVCIFRISFTPPHLVRCPSTAYGHTNFTIF